MNYSHVMRRAQPRTQLFYQRQRFRRTEPPSAADAFIERLARQPLHAHNQDLRLWRVRRMESVPEYVERPAHVRVRHLARQLDFPPEPFNVVRGLLVFETRRLHRHTLVQFFVLRLVHFSHAAARNEANYLESSSQQLSGLEYRGDRSSGREARATLGAWCRRSVGWELLVSGAIYAGWLGFGIFHRVVPRISGRIMPQRFSDCGVA